MLCCADHRPHRHEVLHLPEGKLELLTVACTLSAAAALLLRCCCWCRCWSACALLLQRLPLVFMFLTFVSHTVALVPLHCFYRDGSPLPPRRSGKRRRLMPRCRCVRLVGSLPAAVHRSWVGNWSWRSVSSAAGGHAAAAVCLGAAAAWRPGMDRAMSCGCAMHVLVWHAVKCVVNAIVLTCVGRCRRSRAQWVWLLFFCHRMRDFCWTVFRPAAGHGCGGLAQGGHSVQEERGVPGRD